MADLEIRPQPYDAKSSAELIEELQGEYISRYGGPDMTLVHPAEFAPPDGAFLVAYLDGAAVGCAGFRRLDRGVAEIKRMYVRPRWRRRGLARHLLNRIEGALAAAGYVEVRLMTGVEQPEAIRLYETSGYGLTATGFGEYQGEPGARFFAKRLEDRADASSRQGELP
jgi:GNAT superfamily N-acetyltransferase